MPHICARLPGNGPIAARRHALLEANKAEAEAEAEAEPELKAHTSVCKACQGKHVAHTCARLPGNGPLAARRRAFEAREQEAREEEAREEEAREEAHLTLQDAAVMEDIEATQPERHHAVSPSQYSLSSHSKVRSQHDMNATCTDLD